MIPIAAALLALSASPFSAAPAPAWQGSATSTTAAPSAPRDVAFVSLPRIAPGPNPEVPLVATVSFRTSTPTRVELHVEEAGGARDWTVLAEPDLKSQHEVHVLGMRADRMHSIEVTVIDAQGVRTEAPSALQFYTPPLPPVYFPPVEVVTAKPELMEPGLILINATNARENPAYLVMFDPRLGEDAEDVVVWFYEHPTRRMSDARRLRNGNLLYIFESERQVRKGLMEIDMLGNEVQEWYAARYEPQGAPPGATTVDTDSFHHECFELPEGHAADFVVLSSELRHFPDYPLDEVDVSQTGPMDVVSDVVVEFKRDGTVVNEWSLFDLIDPYRLCYGSLGGFWGTFYGGVTADWSHANAVIYDPTRDGYIVSMRHQDALIGFSRDSGQLDWILGAPGRWRLPWRSHLLTSLDAPNGEPFAHSFHQHAPQLINIQEDGRVTFVLFDNGNHRVIPPTPPPAGAGEVVGSSRAVTYEVDPDAMTAQMTWHFSRQLGDVLAPKSSFLGDADQLPQTGNFLVTDGARSAPDTYARVFQVTRAEPRIAMDVVIRDLASKEPLHWTVYRSEGGLELYPE